MINLIEFKMEQQCSNRDIIPASVWGFWYKPRNRCSSRDSNRLNSEFISTAIQLHQSARFITEYDHAFRQN
jgi:hypothetical protein